jgi:putative nucleotidyltransferase with HDIG domain
MSAPAQFLAGVARALSAMALYRDGHPQRERAIDAAYIGLVDLQSESRHPLFTFLGDEVVYGNLPLREMRDWEWSRRLAAAGIQRLEFQGTTTREELESFLVDVLARVTLATIDTSEVRQSHASGIRFGAVGIRGESEAARPLVTATLSFNLGDEANAMRWLHDEVSDKGDLPIVEAEAVVRSLAVAMHSGSHIVLPLLQLKEFDQYTTTHSLNVSVLSMGLAEYMGLAASDVQAFGVAGLLHDLGKVRIPKDLLIKPGKLTEQERDVIRRHPTDGARIIFESDENLELAAIVAHEHHIMLNGGGYPGFLYERACHRASHLVHVCDVFDALRTNRPYRHAWPLEDVLRYLEEHAGTMFDPDIVQPFTSMIRKNEAEVSVVTGEEMPVLHRETAPPDGAAPVYD